MTHEIVIDRSREEVWKVFDSAENMKKWQPTLQSFEPQSGQPGQVGAVSRLTYEENGRKIVMTETITGRREPEEFSGEYAAGSATNFIKNRFIKLDDGKTKWAMESEFVFHGLLWKLAAPLMKVMIRKRIVKDMDQFKRLAEGQ